MLEITDKDLITENVSNTITIGYFDYNDCRYELLQIGYDPNPDCILHLTDAVDSEIINIIPKVKYKDNIWKLKLIEGIALANNKKTEKIIVNGYSEDFVSEDGILYSTEGKELALTYYPIAKKDKMCKLNNKLTYIFSYSMIDRNPYLEEIIIKNKHINKKNNLWMIK